MLNEQNYNNSCGKGLISPSNMLGHGWCLFLILYGIEDASGGCRLGEQDAVPYQRHYFTAF